MTHEGGPCGPRNQLVGKSSQFREVLARMELVARSSASVLIRGETGTGKGLYAETIHYLSDRASQGFVTLHCGLSPDLIENEVFGHARGAFTGATERREGLVQLADGGTLFLDDFDLLAPVAQAKLLRFLENRVFRPLGSLETLEADVRIIAATNADLEEEIRAGRIRKDFHFRVSGFPLTIPPLRERPEDILPLARHFLRLFESTLTISSTAAATLLDYRWPGNVRELKRVIEVAMIHAGSQRVITASHIELPEAERGSVEPYAKAKRKFDRSYLVRVLTECDGNLARAARAAGLSLRTMQRRCEEHEIDLGMFRDLSR